MGGGRIDVELAGQFLADHEDSYTGNAEATQRSLCGHVDKAKEGIPEWGWKPFYPGGAVTGKVTSSDLAETLSLIAHAGHPCGENFLAAPFFAGHPEYGYLKPILKDMPSGRGRNSPPARRNDPAPELFVLQMNGRLSRWAAYVNDRGLERRR